MTSCFAFSTLVLVSFSAAAGAQTCKLNGPLPLNPAGAGGDVATMELAPDDARVVYLAREAPDQRPELRSLLLEGTHASVVLTEAIREEETIWPTFQISQDGARVVFSTVEYFQLADEGTSGGRLYVVDIDGGRPPTLLVGPLLFNDLTSFRLSPDGAWIVYWTWNEEYGWSLNSIPIDGHAAPNALLHEGEWALTSSGRMVYIVGVGGTVELFSVGLDGQNLVRLNAALPAGCDVTRFAITPDEQHVVYLADQATDQVFELFRVPLDGSGAPVRVNPPLDGTADVTDFAISPDSMRVAYLSDQDVEDVRELFVAPSNGSGPSVKISGTLVNGGVVEPGVGFTPDGGHVVYRADALQDNVVQLFTAPSDGFSAAVPLSGAHAVGGDVHTNYIFGLPAFLMNAGRVVYRADTVTVGQIELFSAPLDGSAAPIRLNGLLVAQGAVTDFELAADGSRVFFRTDALVDQLYELYSAPIDGSSPASRINRVSSGPNSSVPFRVTSDGNLTFYRGAEDEPGFVHLYRRRSDASEPPNIVNGTLSQGDVQGDVDLFVPTADGRLVYRADQSVDGRDEVLIVSIDGLPEPVRLSDPSTTSKSIGYPRLTQDRAVYVQRLDSGRALFSVPLDGGAPPVALRATNGMIDQGYRFTPDQCRVAFLVREDGGTILCGALLDGSSPSVVLDDPPLPTVQFESALAVTPDGARVIYLTDAAQDEEYGLYSVPLDSSGSPVYLSGDLVTGGDVVLAHGYDAPLVTPDGTIAVYRADAEVDERIELYAVAVDGTAAPRKLSGNLVAGGDVDGGFLLDLTGTLVVFAADALVDGLNELFVSPLDASAPPVRVSGPLEADGHLGTARIGPDGRVFYTADPEGDSSLGLFATTLDGGPVVDLTAAEPLHSVLDVAFDPTGARIVYLAFEANGSVDPEIELFAVPIDGSAPPRRLSGFLIPDGDVAEFQITRDGKRVVYLADQDLDEVLELFAVPIDGVRDPVKLNPPLSPGSTVQYGFQLSTDGRRVFYIADAHEPSVFELFQTFLWPRVWKVERRAQ